MTNLAGGRGGKGGRGKGGKISTRISVRLLALHVLDSAPVGTVSGHCLVDGERPCVWKELKALAAGELRTSLRTMQMRRPPSSQRNTWKSKVRNSATAMHGSSAAMETFSSLARKSERLERERGRPLTPVANRSKSDKNRRPSPRRCQNE